CSAPPGNAQSARAALPLTRSRPRGRGRPGPSGPRVDGGIEGDSTRFSRSHRHGERDLVAADRATGETQPAVQATHEVIERRQTVGRDVAAEAYQPGAYRDRVILHVDRDPGGAMNGR